MDFGLTGKRALVTGSTAGVTPGELEITLSPTPAQTGPGERDPGRAALRADDHAPVFAVRVGSVWPRWWNIDPGDQGGVGGKRGLDLVQRGDLAD